MFFLKSFKFILLVTAILVGFQNCMSNKNSSGLINDPNSFDLPPEDLRPQQTIILSTETQLTFSKQKQIGFLHGFNGQNFNVDSETKKLVENLLPQFWRIGLNQSVGSNYIFAKQINPQIKITAVLSDLLVTSKSTTYSQYHPWEDWAGFENDVKNIVLSTQKNNSVIDFWDVWSEPDTSSMWKGDCSQLLEMFRRAHGAIKSVMPSAKLVGPSVANIFSLGDCQTLQNSPSSEALLTKFVTYLLAQGIYFDAISWHEFDHPESIPTMATNIRNFYAQQLNVQTPEIHINEYAGPANYRVPSEALAWLFYLEKANVNQSHHACWENGVECLEGLDGLFKTDSKTPLPLYWVYRAYAELPDVRFDLNSTQSTDVLGLGGMNLSSGRYRFLIGRLQTQNVSSPAELGFGIKINELPTSVSTYVVTVTKISGADPLQAMPTQPSVSERYSLKTFNRSAILSIHKSLPGDVFIIDLNPFSNL